MKITKKMINNTLYSPIPAYLYTWVFPQEVFESTFSLKTQFSSCFAYVIYGELVWWAGFIFIQILQLA